MRSLQITALGGTEVSNEEESSDVFLTLLSQEVQLPISIEEGQTLDPCGVERDDLKMSSPMFYCLQTSRCCV